MFTVTARLVSSTTNSVYIWLKKNGGNVPNSGTILTSTANTSIVPFTFIVNAADYDIYELWGVTSTGTGTLTFASSSGLVPAIPAINVAVSQIG
jgi:hypothetical protein